MVKTIILEKAWTTKTPVYFVSETYFGLIFASKLFNREIVVVILFIFAFYFQ